MRLPGPHWWERRFWRRTPPGRASSRPTRTRRSTCTCPHTCTCRRSTRHRSGASRLLLLRPPQHSPLPRKPRPSISVRPRLPRLRHLRGRLPQSRPRQNRLLRAQRLPSAQNPLPAVPPQRNHRGLRATPNGAGLCRRCSPRPLAPAPVRIPRQMCLHLMRRSRSRSIACRRHHRRANRLRAPHLRRQKPARWNAASRNWRHWERHRNNPPRQPSQRETPTPA